MNADSTFVWICVLSAFIGGSPFFLAFSSSFTEGDAKGNRGVPGFGENHRQSDAYALWLSTTWRRFRSRIRADVSARFAAPASRSCNTSSGLVPNHRQKSGLRPDPAFLQVAHARI